MRLEIGSYTVQGERPSMEDVVLIEPDFLGKATEKDVVAIGEALPDSASLFAVFDGHQGAAVANWLKENYIKHLWSAITATSKNTKRIPNLLIKAFEVAAKTCDKELMSYAVNHCKNDRPATDGSTALICLVWNDQFVISQIGDSRAIRFESGKAKSLIPEHTPGNKDEFERLRAKGFKITQTGTDFRVQGNKSSITRALGDYRFKQDGVMTCEPESKAYECTKDLVLLASDGLFEHNPPANVLATVNASKGMDLDELAEALATEALENGSKDNISVVIFRFQ